MSAFSAHSAKGKHLFRFAVCENGLPLPLSLYILLEFLQILFGGVFPSSRSTAYKFFSALRECFSDIKERTIKHYP